MDLIMSERNLKYLQSEMRNMSWIMLSQYTSNYPSIYPTLILYRNVFERNIKINSTHYSHIIKQLKRQTFLIKE